MRLFNLISAWFMWVICACYVVMVTFLRVMNNLPINHLPAEQLTRYTMIFWVGLAMFTALATILWTVKQRFWFARNQTPGTGFWLVNVGYYGSTLFVIVAGFAPYLAGDRSVIQWASCGLGIVFTILGFPRLPKPGSATQPPPLPG